jgi:ribonuclease HIII
MADLREIQTKVKELAGQRDRIVREQAVEESRLAEAYDKLRELGITDPEKLSAQEIQDMATKLQAELDQKLNALETQVQEGEALMAKYQQEN